MSDTGIDNLVIKINTEADGASKGIESLIGSLEKLEAITGKLTTSNSTLKQLGDSFKYVKSTSKDLTLGTTTKTLNGLSDGLNKMEKSTASLNKSLRTSSKLFNLGGLVRIGKTIANVFSTSIKAANDYVESQNLFLVAMGEYADEATEWSNMVSDALGIDPAEMQKNMGYFQQLATALGVANDQAYILTKNMTSLAYDISSLYNIGIDQSFLKLQSAIVGELEPIRRLGIDISKARLQQELYDLGIQRNVETLSQADKAILRYLAIMKQTKNAQADMGKTLMSPANALRVLKSSFIQLSRSVGYIFIPILQTLLPILQLVTQAMAKLAEKLAFFLGYEQPKFDTSGLEDAGDDIGALGDALDDTAAKIKSFTTGFDELNVISNNTSGLGGTQDSILGGIVLPEYDILSKYAGNLTDEVLPKLMKAFEAFGESPGVQLALKILKALFDNIKDFGEWILENPETFGEFMGNLALAIGAFAGFKVIDGVVTSFQNLFNLLTSDRFVKIAGWALLITGAFLALNGVVNLSSGEFENLGKTAKTILVGIGIFLVGLGAAFHLAVPAIVGGVVVLVTAFWEELQSFLSRIMSAIIKGISYVAFTLKMVFGDLLITLVKTVGKTVANAFDWIASKSNDTFGSVGDNAELTFLKLKKSFLEMINSIIQNEHVQAFAAFLDETFDTNIAAKLKVGIDTSEVSAAIKQIESEKAILNGNIYGPFQPGKEPQSFSHVARVEQEFEEIFDDFKNEVAAAVDSKNSALQAVDDFTSGYMEFWDTKAAQKKDEGLTSQFEIDDDMWETIGESFTGLFESSEEQLNKLFENGEIAAQQLDTQESQLSEAKVANELSEADAVVLNKTLEAADTGNVKLDNLWWKLNDVQKACEDIQIDVYNTYVSGGADEYAAGGLPSKGDLFIANEAGPEFIGSIGSQTAVANSDQMVAAFAQGVYQGMMAARRDGGSQKIQVPVSVLLPNGRALATATAEGQIDNGYDMGLGGFDV